MSTSQIVTSTSELMMRWILDAVLQLKLADDAKAAVTLQGLIATAMATSAPRRTLRARESSGRRRQSRLPLRRA